MRPPTRFRADTAGRTIGPLADHRSVAHPGRGETVRLLRGNAWGAAGAVALAAMVACGHGQERRTERVTCLAACQSRLSTAAGAARTGRHDGIIMVHSRMSSRPGQWHEGPLACG
jgi:hypothetical protein